MDEQSKAQEAARQSHEARRAQQQREQQQREHQAREGATEATRVSGQLAGLGTEAMAVWGDVTQRALRDVAELSARTTQESTRQVTEWQQMNMDFVREAQAAMFRWSTIWPEVFRDPIRYYQRTLEESIEATQRVFQVTRRNAETMMETCQRLEHASEDATKSLGETFRDASTRMQDVYARSDRLRAA
jgi:hypothetical protein